MESNSNTKKMTFIGVMLVLIVTIISVSFAYFTVNPEVIGEIFSVTGTAKNDTPVITFTEDKSGVTLTNTYPMTDDVAIKNVDAYNFSVRSDEASKDLAITVVLEVTSGSNLDDSLVNILLDGGVMTLSNLKEMTPSTDSYRNTYVIDQYILSPGETKSSSLQTWINENGTIENAQNKTWSSKLMVIPEFAEESQNYKFNAVQTVLAMEDESTVYGINAGSPDFGTIATTDEGVYSMEDNYGTSYYYRGAVENNYVKFAGFFWRIIRINGDGSLRLIYDGTVSHENGKSSIDRVAMTEIPWNTDYYNDAKYVGYMYGGANSVASTSKAGAQTNETSSNVKTQLEAWYVANIETTGYEKYLTDVIFCNDRSTSSTTETWWAADTALGFGTSPTAYGAFNRLITKKQPSFICPENNAVASTTNSEGKYNNDWFTADATNSNKGNGALNQPVGLITADEIAAAGGAEGYTNSNYYLYKNYWFWTLSPGYVYVNDRANVFIVITDGYLAGNDVHGLGAVAPVINLSAETVKTLVGNGTIGNEYRLPDVA